jgi:tetratricopeptide (TPR) repeat protein
VVAGNLARVRVSAEQWTRAEVLLAEAYRIRGKLAPATVGQVAAQLGEVRLRLGKTKSAVVLLREAWQAHLQTYGQGHPATAARARTLGRVLSGLERHSESILPLRQARSASQASGDRASAAASGFLLGVALYRCGTVEEGVRLVDEAVRWTRAERGPGGAHHRELPDRLTSWSALLLDRGRVDEAEGVLREALEVSGRLYGDQSVQVALRTAALGGLSARLGRVDEAMAWLEAAASLLRSTAGDSSVHTRQVVITLIELAQVQATRALDSRDKGTARMLVERVGPISVAVLGAADSRVQALQILAQRAH